MSIRRFFIWFLLIVVGLALQGSILREVLPFGAVPNVLFMFIVFLAVRYGNILAAIGAFFLGMIIDISGAISIGPWAASSQVVFALFVILHQGLFIRSAFSVIVATTVSTLVGSLVALFLTGAGDMFSFLFIGTILAEAFLTGLCAPLVFKILDAVVAPTGENLGVHRRRFGVGY